RTQQHRTSETADGGMGSISKDQHSSSTVCRNSNTASMMNSDTISNSSDDSSKREGRSTTSGSMSGGGSLLGSIRRIFAPGAINVTNDRLYRTSACYVSSSVPTHEVHHWVKTSNIKFCFDSSMQSLISSNCVYENIYWYIFAVDNMNS
ncbi:unnamed protein product, partial [Rotaria magnacalcarata]